MKCQNCGKNNANVKYTQVINGDKMQLFLCDECANEMNIGMNFDFGMHDVFSNFFDEFSGLKTITIPEISKCNTCGTSYDEFSKTGMFGCEKCYSTFSNRLDEVLNRIHGSNRHLKISDKNKDVTGERNDNQEIVKLRNELNKCIEREEYEKAAIIRDKIKKLEK